MEDDYKLGTWVSNQRTRAEELLPERRRRLDELGFVWDPFGLDWEGAFAALVKFKQREGHCGVPRSHIEGGYRLGEWAHNQRADANKMPPDRKRRLDELGFVWDPLGLDWEDAFAALVRFKQREGHCRVPQTHMEGDYKLGVWVSTQRTAAENLSPDRRKRLDELGFVWDPRTTNWEHAFAALETFKEREGHCRVLRGHIEGGYKLALWVNRQRADAEKLLPERRRRLDELGFVWDPLGLDWENGFAALVEFEQREGHCRVPRGYIEGDYKLSIWVSTQRTDANKMPPDRKRRLDELGFVWDPFGLYWEDAFAALVKFKERKGHCRVPVSHIEGGYRLGTWVSNQRTDANKMPPDRKRRLDELGFVWDVHAADWENGFAALVEFEQREGHCRVPRSHIEADYKLGRWVNKQRALGEKMNVERRKKLDELGFL
jgi:hypothetical protein